MRSFLFASAALCLTAFVSGCDTPTEPVKQAPIGNPAPADPSKPEGKMEGPGGAPAPAPAEKPAEPPK